MSATGPAPTPQVLALTTEYSTPYAALIRDEVVMGVSRYFLERWLPVLGPAPAALVNTLRQLDYRSQDTTISISGAALAKEAGMSRRHLYTCMAHPWFGAFVRTLSGQRARDAEGKIWQQVNRYAVRMDDPLTPGDAARLLELLPTLADTPLQAAAQAMSIPPRDLWAPSPGAEHPAFAAPNAVTARDVMLRAFPQWKDNSAEAQTAFNQLAEALHRHVTLGREDGRTSKIIVPQYFRRRWWKRLGHDLAWVYLWLRGITYDRPDEGIQRDTCWVPALDTLLGLIGRPREWWRRNVEQAKPHKDGWSVNDFFEQIEQRKGRDPANPQWVARRFRVALEIPIAPEDRAAYEALLREWPADGIPAKLPGANGSATPAHTGSAEVRHIGAHWTPNGAPHPRTPDSAGSATSAHTGDQEVRHISTQGSATAAHSKNQHPREATPLPSATEEPHSKPPDAGSAAAAPVEAGQGEQLADLLKRTFEQAPATPLYEAAPVRVWLEQGCEKAILPHTPAWTLAESGALPPRELVALMLAARADSTVQEPPRYVSWLAQRRVHAPDTPPVDRWAEWLALAGLSLSEWVTQGRMRWMALAPHSRRTLPFGLDDLVPEQGASPASPPPRSDGVIGSPPRASEPDPSASGLDTRPNGGRLTIGDIWHATVGQLRLQLNRVTFQTWVEGAQAIAYRDGVLTVQARTPASREWLATRLAPVIARTVESLAGQPLRVEYVAKNGNSGSRE